MQNYESLPTGRLREIYSLQTAVQMQIADNPFAHCFQMYLAFHVSLFNSLLQMAAHVQNFHKENSVSVSHFAHIYNCFQNKKKIPWVQKRKQNAKQTYILLFLYFLIKKKNVITFGFNKIFINV